jgi:hypothetical protein
MTISPFLIYLRRIFLKNKNINDPFSKGDDKGLKDLEPVE